MSFAARLIHTLTIERTTFDDSSTRRDEYGQPVPETATFVVQGLVQPRVVSEVQDPRSAGPEIATHTIFFAPMNMYVSDAVIDDGGKRYEIVGIRSFDFGRTPHLEVDVRSVDPVPSVLVEAGS